MAEAIPNIERIDNEILRLDREIERLKGIRSGVCLAKEILLKYEAERPSLPLTCEAGG